jgi:hypothetical protein
MTTRWSTRIARPFWQDWTKHRRSASHITNGQEAAQATVALMRNTFTHLPPEDLLKVYLDRKKGEEITKLSHPGEHGSFANACRPAWRLRAGF